MMGNKSFVFRFDDVEVREREFSLIKAGEVLPVEPKAFRVLLFLLHNPQRLISKEELLNAVWGDAAVTESSLTRCIWLLRRLLGDDIHEPRYIATVATVGYRFVCKVEVSEDDLGNLEATGTVPAKDKSHPRWRLRGAIPWLLVVPLICLAAYVFYFRNRSQPPTYYSSEPLTNYVGSEICPSFSPDGERVAFAWNGEKQDNFDIYVKQIGDGALLRLTSDPKPDVSPAWSPDGRTIAFLRLNSNDRAEVLLIPSVAAAPSKEPCSSHGPTDVISSVQAYCLVPG